MSRNSLQDNAPGETRTPNLLIRSQSVAPRIDGATLKSQQVAAKEAPKADTASHNISHNASPVRSFRVPREMKKDQGQLHLGKTEKALPSVANQQQEPRTWR